MNNKYLIFGIVSACAGILCLEAYKLRKTYINFKRRKNRSWKYYE